MCANTTEEYFLIAKIKSVFGSEGFVSVISYSDDVKRFFDLECIFIDVFGGMRKFFIEELRKRKDGFVIKFKNFNSDEEVNFLINCSVFIDQKNSIVLKESEHFVHDLLNSGVFLDGILMGELKDVMTLPTNDLYVVQTLEGKEVLIPAVSEYIKKFDAGEKRLDLTSSGKMLFDD